MIWLVYTLPGLLALLLNGSAVIIKHVEKEFQKKNKKHDEASLEIIVAAVFGVVGVLPPLFFREKMLCGFDSAAACHGTEDCFGNSVPCILNRASVFIIMASVQVLACKLMTLHTKIGHPTMQNRDIKSHRFRWLAVAVPTLLCAVSYVLDIITSGSGSKDGGFHLARSGVLCRMRYATSVQEALLVHVWMIASVVVLVLYLGKCFKLSAAIVSRAMPSDAPRAMGSLDGKQDDGLQGRKGGCISGWWTSLRKSVRGAQKVQKIGRMCLVFVIVLSFWVSVTIQSIPEFENFLANSDAWFRCVKFVYAREQLLGQDEWENLRAEFDGTQCPSYPDSGSLYQSQILRSLSEAAIPLTIALFFSLKVSLDGCRKAMRGKKASKRVVDVIKRKMDVNPNTSDQTTGSMGKSSNDHPSLSSPPTGTSSTGSSQSSDDSLRPPMPPMLVNQASMLDFSEIEEPASGLSVEEDDVRMQSYVGNVVRNLASGFMPKRATRVTPSPLLAQVSSQTSSKSVSGTATDEGKQVWK
jgi:hypothetical protein